MRGPDNLGSIDYSSDLNMWRPTGWTSGDPSPNSPGDIRTEVGGLCTPYYLVGERRGEKRQVRG